MVEQFQLYMMSFKDSMRSCKRIYLYRTISVPICFSKIPAGKKAAGVAFEIMLLAAENYHKYYTSLVDGIEEICDIGFEVRKIGQPSHREH